VEGLAGGGEADLSPPPSRPSGWRGALGSVLSYVLAASFAAGSLLTAGDWLLGRLGYPARAPVRASHPPSLRETRVSAEFQYTFETNTQGLRYPDIPLKKPAGEWRVFVIGDSVTEGDGVEAPETFAALLESRFSRPGQRVRFINGGLGGTGPLQYARQFLHTGLAYEPDALLICISANDVANTPADGGARDIYAPFLPDPTGLKGVFWTHWPRAYLAGREAIRRLGRRFWPEDPLRALAQAARERRIPETRVQAWRTNLGPELEAAVRSGQLGAHIIGPGLLRPSYWTESLDLVPQSSQRSFSVMASILDETVRKALGRGIRVGVAFLPANIQYEPSSYAHLSSTGLILRPRWLETDTAVQVSLAAWAAAQGLPFIDLTAVFREARSRSTGLSFPLDGHWTASGHKVAADALAKWMAEGTRWIGPGSGPSSPPSVR
jgi:lysophospholipase L1-like esterase